MNLTLLRLSITMEKRNILVEFLDVMFTFVTAIVVCAFGLLFLNISFEFILSLISKFV